MIIMAMLIMAAFGAMAQDSVSVVKKGEDYYIQHFSGFTKTGETICKDYIAEKVDPNEAIVKATNSIHTSSILQLSAVGMAAVGGLFYLNGVNRVGTCCLIISGGLGIASSIALYQDRLYLSPDGVIVKIGKK